MATDGPMAQGRVRNRYEAFADPRDAAPLTADENGLGTPSGERYDFLDGNPKIVDFIGPSVAGEQENEMREMYDAPASLDIYRNFLDWLFATFEEDEMEFRGRLIAHLDLKPGFRVLVTGCGFGDDLQVIAAAVGTEGEVHAQDLSRHMVETDCRTAGDAATCFSISSALALPYREGYFDAVFHFGGINLFGDTARAIAEMDRVCRPGGKVVFSDEGGAPHLRGTTYADVVINNNGLWAAEAPVAALPHTAREIKLTYVLGNCFYVISFVAGNSLPVINIDVPHKGLRGGSARTRFFGQVEGLKPETRERVYAEAKARNVSVHDLLESIISSKLDDGI